MEHITRNIGLTLGLVLMFGQVMVLQAQHDKMEIKSGNKSYESKDYDSALRAYDLALRINPKNQTALFNKADALYKAEKFDEAAEIFSQLAKTESNDKRKAEALHNLGNSYLKKEKYKESVDAYRQSLRLNPSDEQTRYNLAYATQKLKKQEEQNKSCDKPGENDKGDKDKEKQGDKGDKGENNKDGEKKPDDKGDKGDKNEDAKGDKDKKENKPEDGKEGQADKPERPKPMSKEEAEMMLNALEKSEKDTQKKVMKATQPVKKNPAEKDW